MCVYIYVSTVKWLRYSLLINNPYAILCPKCKRTGEKRSQGKDNTKKMFCRELLSVIEESCIKLHWWCQISREKMRKGKGELWRPSSKRQRVPHLFVWCRLKGIPVGKSASGKLLWLRNPASNDIWAKTYRKENYSPECAGDSSIYWHLQQKELTHSPLQNIFLMRHLLNINHGP